MHPPVAAEQHPPQAHTEDLSKNAQHPGGSARPLKLCVSGSLLVVVGVTVGSGGKDSLTGTLQNGLVLWSSGCSQSRVRNASVVEEGGIWNSLLR